MFNVVTDQLKVSQGWVRCGHCSEVFDASLHMQAPAPAPVVVASAPVLDAAPVVVAPVLDAAPAILATSLQDIEAPFVLVPVSTLTQSKPEPVYEPSFEPRFEHEPELKIKSESESESEYESDLEPKLDGAWLPGALWADSLKEEVFTPKALPQAVSGQDLPQAMPPDLRSNAFDYPPLSEASSESDFFASKRPEDAYVDVSFVRDAQRQALWRRPLVRWGLILVCVLLAVLLLLQLTLQQKDNLAARYPFSKPWLELLCKPLGCQITALRQIQFVVIDSSSFSKLNTQAYRLSFSLKSTSSVPLAMPFIEVTLTDSQDRAVLRRVFAPAQFGAANSLLLPNLNFSALLGLQLDVAAEQANDVTAVNSQGHASTAISSRIAGYRLLAFYP